MKWSIMQQAISNDLHSMEDEIMKKVLIVDDEEDMIWSLQKNLPNSKLKVETLTASSGEEALEVLNQTDVDLIVTDIKMPGMSGLDLLSEVNSRYPHLGVIVMTAYSSQEWETEAILRGGYSYIEKPFDINEMRRVINQALQGKEDTMHGEPSGEAIHDISTLAVEIPAAEENECPEYILKTPENVQEVLSEEGDIDESIVNSLLNFSIEDLLNEDDLGHEETVLVDGRSIEDTIVDSLIDVSEESTPAPANQVTSPIENEKSVETIQERREPENDVPAEITQEESPPEDDKSAPTNQAINTLEKENPLQTKQELNDPEADEPIETKWVMNTRHDNDMAESKWVINTRDNDEPEETVQETGEREDDEAEETKWVIRTRDDYEPPKTKWVLKSRDSDEPAETLQETDEREDDEAEGTKWVIRTRDD